jgi:hypothetical protein
MTVLRKAQETKLNITVGKRRRPRTMMRRRMSEESPSMHVRDLIQFLGELSENNNRAWFVMNKPRYDILREEFLALTIKLIAEISKFDPAMRAAIRRRRCSASTVTCASRMTSARTRRTSRRPSRQRIEEAQPGRRSGLLLPHQ